METSHLWVLRNVAFEEYFDSMEASESQKRFPNSLAPPKAVARTACQTRAPITLQLRHQLKQHQFNRGVEKRKMESVELFPFLSSLVRRLLHPLTLSRNKIRRLLSCSALRLLPPVLFEITSSLYPAAWKSY